MHLYVGSSIASTGDELYAINVLTPADDSFVHFIAYIKAMLM